MLYWSEIFGASVFTSQRKIGHIEDILLDPDKKVISGFLLERRNTDFRHRYFSFTAIASIKRDRIALKEPIEIKALTKMDSKKSITSEDFLHHTILDEKGEWVGRVVDFGFDPSKGFVREITLSNSLIDDLWHGRKKMPVLGQVEFSKEFIHIDQDTREEISGLHKGLKNWLGIE